MPYGFRQVTLSNCHAGSATIGDAHDLLSTLWTRTALTVTALDSLHHELLVYTYKTASLDIGRSMYGLRSSDDCRVMQPMDVSQRDVEGRHGQGKWDMDPWESVEYSF